MQEGYFDCQLALNFNYPKEKRKKLFERKEKLAKLAKINDKYRGEVNREIIESIFDVDCNKQSFVEQYQSKGNINFCVSRNILIFQIFFS